MNNLYCFILPIFLGGMEACSSVIAFHVNVTGMVVAY